MGTSRFHKAVVRIHWHSIILDFLQESGVEQYSLKAFPSLYSFNTRWCRSTSFPGCSFIKNTVISLRNIGGHDVKPSLSRSKIVFERQRVWHLGLVRSDQQFSLLSFSPCDLFICWRLDRNIHFRCRKYPSNQLCLVSWYCKLSFAANQPQSIDVPRDHFVERKTARITRHFVANLEIISYVY